MNKTELIAAIRTELRDTDENNYFWSDAEIDQAIAWAVMEYSTSCPIEQRTDLPTTEGSDELDISGLEGLIRVKSVEYPIGYRPPYYQHFRYWAGHLQLPIVGDGRNARVSWLKKHTVTAQSSTIPPEHDHIIVLGAAVHLAWSASVSLIERLNLSGRYGTQGFRLWAQRRYTEYLKKLKQVAQSNRVQGTIFYTEDE